MRPKALIATSAILALFLVFGAAASGASATAGSHAVVAKKCKKKHGKKKKCKKHAPAPAPTPLTAPPPTTQVTTQVTTPPSVPIPTTSDIKEVDLSWCTAPTDMDLHIWNSDGKHAGWRNAAGGVENQIPNGLHHGDDSGSDGCLNGDGGLEYFTDTAGNSHAVTIGVCYAANSWDHDFSASFSVDVYYTDGTSDQYGTGHAPPFHIDNLEQPGDSMLLLPGTQSEYIPGNFCPSP